jgi:hypothetical protein
MIWSLYVQVAILCAVVHATAGAAAVVTPRWNRLCLSRLCRWALACFIVSRGLEVGVPGTVGAPGQALSVAVASNR